LLSELALSESPDSVLPDPQMLALSTAQALEDALILWAETVVERTMQPAYLGMVRLLVAELPRFPALGPLFYSAVPQQGAAHLIALLRHAENKGIIRVHDYEAVIRLIAGGLLTYTLAGLFGSDAQPPTSEQIGALIRAVVRALSVSTA
jgi:TetR/AcrR family transcriptional regulator, mexJK operon transcriptional repressor